MPGSLDLGSSVDRRASFDTLVGGYTGTRFATAVLEVGAAGSTTTVARLPQGLRYAGVAALGTTIFVAGGVTTGGEVATITAIDTRSGSVRSIGRLPAALAHAPLVASGSSLYLIGGVTASGRSVDSILRIDGSSGAVTLAGRLPAPVADAAAVSLGASVVVLGGGGRAVYEFWATSDNGSESPRETTRGSCQRNAVTAKIEASPRPTSKAVASSVDS